MSTIQLVGIEAATSDEVATDVAAVQSQPEPMSEWREITPESAKAIASWWQSPGLVGHVLASFASGMEVDRGELLDDIHRTSVTDKLGEAESRELDCLATFIINY